MLKVGLETSKLHIVRTLSLTVHLCVSRQNKVLIIGFNTLNCKGVEEVVLCYIDFPRRFKLNVKALCGSR